MAIDAFVLPYPGRSVGVVFWGAARVPRRGRRGPAEPAGAAEFATYAPGEISPGEVAELQNVYTASLGNALRAAGRRSLTFWHLFLWWLAGLVTLILLTLRTLEIGPGYAWLVLAATATALPIAAGRPLWPARHRAAARARLRARESDALIPVRGNEPRLRERLDGLWRTARRLTGSVEQQLYELESYCREHAWREAAAFYADERRAMSLGDGAEDAPVVRRLFLRTRALTRAATYAAVEMRAW